MKTSTKTTLGAAGATLAAAAAAYYLYGSKNAEKNRAQLKSWAEKAEREIVREAKRFKNKALTDTNLNAIITGVARQYEATRDLDADDVREFIATMKERWQEARGVMKGKQRKVSTRKRVKAS